MVRLGPRVPGKAKPALGPRRFQKGFRELGELCQVVSKDHPGSRKS